MGCDVTQSLEEELPYHCTIKVHRLMYLELKKLVDRISCIISDMEFARPRCKSGIEAYCSFHNAMDKAKLLIQHCSECSKLYSAITADRIQLRFQRTRDNLELCLSEIQTIVPPLLAEKISGTICDLRNAKFPLEPSEDEAGKGVLSLLLQDIQASSSINHLELEALQLAFSKLSITSRSALLIEKRSIKRLLDKVSDSNPRKKKVLKYLLYLLIKYGDLICQQKTDSTLVPQVNNVWDDSEVHSSGLLEPPEQFKCPISMRLMYDPVIIASGKTFERLCIESWFSRGNRTCPKTHMELDDLSLIPNLAMKELISKWCLKHGITISAPQAQPMPALLSSWKSSSSCSIASFGSSIDNLHLQVSNVSLRSSDTDRSFDLSYGKTNDSIRSGLHRVNADSNRDRFSTTRDAMNLTFLSTLAIRPWGSQCDVVENVKKQLKDNEQTCCLAFSNRYLKPLIQFLKDAYDSSDAKAQKDGAEVLFAILSYSRDEMPRLQEEEIYALVSFLGSEITGKALEIIEVLSCQQCYNSSLVASGILPSILKVLDTEIRDFHELAIKILYNLSCNGDIVYHIVYLDCLPKLVCFLEDPILARYCIKIIGALCTYEEAKTAVVETNLCVSSIAKQLETGTSEEQEHIVDILLAICYERAECCQLAMTESIIPCLVYLSTNGDSRVKETAKELLLLFQHDKEGKASKRSNPEAAICADTARKHDSTGHHEYNQRTSRGFGFMGKKLSRFRRANH